MRWIELLKRYQISIDKNESLLLLTHRSFSEKNHSRYVFLGQFAFKGEVSKWIAKNVSGTGTQLQHYLGNLVTNKRLDWYFDRWQIKGIRMHESIEINAQKHIFVLAILGYICEKATPEILQEIIVNEFIKPSDHLLPNTHKFKNTWDQLIFLCKQQFDCKPKQEHFMDENKVHHIKIVVQENVFEASSISYKYAKKKAIALSYKAVTEIVEQHLKNDPFYQERLQMIKQEEEQKVLFEKSEKQRIHLERIERHQAKMSVRKTQLKLKAQEQDKLRRQKKQELKEKKSRKGANTIYREYTIEEIKAMSPSKRRNLQDKGIIPKGLDF